MGTSQRTFSGTRTVREDNGSAYINLPKDGIEEICDFDEFISREVHVEVRPQDGIIHAEIID